MSYLNSALSITSAAMLLLLLMVFFTDGVKLFLTGGLYKRVFGFLSIIAISGILICTVAGLGFKPHVNTIEAAITKTH